jgi:hypothetical protein
MNLAAADDGDTLDHLPVSQDDLTGVHVAGESLLGRLSGL